MYIELSESQTRLVESAAGFFGARASDAVGLEPTEMRAQAWCQMAELGWTGVIADEALGGETGILEAALIAEQMGYAHCQVPFVEGAMCCSALLRALPGSDSRARLLTDIAGGVRFVCLALCEDRGEWLAQEVQTQVASGRALTARKRFVHEADLADDLLIVAKEDEALVLLTVPAAAASVRLLPTLSNAPLFELSVEGFSIGPDNVLASHADVGTALETGLYAGGLGEAARMVGLSQRALDLCVEHAGFREQSGRPIGGFQAIQHQLADMLRDLEGARWMTYRAAWQCDHPDDGAMASNWRTDSQMALAYAGEACLRVVRRAHQIMGAIGYSEEHVLHRLHKQVHAASLSYGNPSACLDQIAAGLG